MSSGDSRQYVIDLPVPYDMNKPYRFIMASHGSGGEGNDIQREKYYGLQNIADAASSVIFVSASGLGGSWGLKDVPLFDDILAFVEQNACVDTSRVFVLGFSFGGMYSYSLSMTRQKTIRAGIGMSPANYNIQIPPKTHDADRLDAIDRDERHHLSLGHRGTVRPTARSTSPSNTARTTDAPCPTPFRRGHPATCSATTSPGAGPDIRSRCARSTADTVFRPGVPIGCGRSSPSSSYRAWTTHQRPRGRQDGFELPVRLQSSTALW